LVLGLGVWGVRLPWIPDAVCFYERAFDQLSGDGRLFQRGSEE